MLRYFAVLAGALMMAAPAFAQTYQVPMQQAPYAAPRMVVVAPAQQPPQRSDLGGGLLQFLFSDNQGSPVVAMPQPAPPQPEPPRPIYANADPRIGTAPQPVPQAPMPVDPRYQRQQVAYDTKEAPGTIVIDTPHKFLYLVEADGKAMRYGIGVGRPGFTWSGVHTITAKKEWPSWVPPKEMLERQPYLPRFMEGGPRNPLGARALYIGSTLYRIHGTNESWTIGHNVSSGCIRLRNADVIDLYNRVPVGTKVVVM